MEKSPDATIIPVVVFSYVFKLPSLDPASSIIAKPAVMHWCFQLKWDRAAQREKRG